ncbi:MAG: PaaI family thioesterase [Blastomonas sp.]
MDAHPFADLIGLTFDSTEPGSSRCRIMVAPEHLNPHGVVHGAVLYAMADTGMGGALMPMLVAEGKGQACATIDIRIVYFLPVFTGEIICETQLDHRGGRTAHLTSRIMADGKLVAQANGTFAIMNRCPG